MKHLSKALVALSLLGLASAAQAQLADYFGTTFDGTTAFPYNDATVYSASAAGTELGGQGGFTATTAGFAQALSGTFVPGQAGANGIVGALASQSNAGTNATPGVTLSHALGAATTVGYNFNVDFNIADTGGAGAPGNAYAFNFTTGGTNIFSVNFLPTGTDGAPTPQLLVGGTVVATATQGPTIDKFIHLTINVSAAGNIVASLGTAASMLTSPTAVPAAAAINGFSISEVKNTAATAGADFVEFDNISVAQAPEPSTYVMMGLGLLGMLGMMKFRRAKA